jgi:hypothetical protein
MFVFAHHMAVELFGREFSPHGAFEHVCAFGVIGLLLATSAYGTWTLALRLLTRLSEQRGKAPNSMRPS